MGFASVTLFYSTDNIQGMLSAMRLTSTLICLRNNYRDSISRVQVRVLGTLTGTILAATLIDFCHSPLFLVGGLYYLATLRLAFLFPDFAILFCFRLFYYADGGIYDLKPRSFPATDCHTPVRGYRDRRAVCPLRHSDDPLFYSPANSPVGRPAIAGRKA